jgi:hypothetical protein
MRRRCKMSVEKYQTNDITVPLGTQHRLRSVPNGTVYLLVFMLPTLNPDGVKLIISNTQLCGPTVQFPLYSLGLPLR